MFETELISNQIIHLKFRNQVSMCRTMMRFAEHFEGPKHRETVFGRKEYLAWYRAETGTNYYTDWGGYNVPSWAFKPFIRGEFGPLTEAETAVLAAVKRMRSGFYVIATLRGGEAKRHELAHAFYYTKPSYRRAVDALLSRLPMKKYVKGKIAALGYHPDVIEDELHAYLVDGIADLDRHTGCAKRLGKKGMATYVDCSQKLNDIFGIAIAN